MTDPDKILKQRLKEERKLEKQKAKLEKKYQAGKIDKETYLKELDKIGFTTQEQLIRDFRKMIQDEISYLENLEPTENSQDAGTSASSTPSSTPPPPPPTSIDEDPYMKDYKDTFHAVPEPPGFEREPEAEESDSEEGPEVEFEEVSEDAADWEIDEGDIEYEEEEKEEFEEEEDYIDRDHSHDQDVVKVDRRTGVVEYDEIKTWEYSDESIVDDLKEAAVVGERKKRKKVKRRRGREEERKRVREKEEEEEEEMAADSELAEAEQLVIGDEFESAEELDLDEVMIPDLISIKKKEKAETEIMWEADAEDQQWLDKRFGEEIETLSKEYQEWRERKREIEEEKAEDWEIYKLVTKMIPVKGKKRQKKRVWKVRIKPKKAERVREGERKRVREREKVERIEWD